jgi:superoxide dismutase, Fe-Mn family
MYTEQQFSIPPLQGISEKTMEEHKKLYAGYVKHANLVMEHIQEFSKDSEKYAYELGELQRRFSFEWGGMRNHECYFNLLSGGAQAINMESGLAKAIIAQWGTFEAWLVRFQAIALTRGIGWAMLYYDPLSKQLVHGWVDEQHLGQLAGCRLVVALDMWEHAFVADYLPSGKKQYVMDFMNQVNWSAAQANFEAALGTL